MTGHVFISYSHAGDSAYVNRLADHLTRVGIPVWFDRDIITGTRWERVIREQIDTCAAFVVVMTPLAEESEWISLEINRAALKQRPILPLLLDGEGFFRLSTVQHENVTGGKMPSAAFLNRLHAHQGPPRPDPRQPNPVFHQPGKKPVTAAEVAFWDICTPIARLARKAAGTGDHAQAAKLYREIIEQSARHGMRNEQHHLDARGQLAFHLGESGDRAEAIRRFAELITDWTRLQGADRWGTLSVRHHHARNIGESGDRTEAIRLLRDLIADRTRYAGIPGIFDGPKEVDKQWLSYFGG